MLAASRARRSEGHQRELRAWSSGTVTPFEHLRRDDPAAYEAELREEAAEPDEVHMARPVFAALADEAIARVMRERDAQPRRRSARFRGASGRTT